MVTALLSVSVVIVVRLQALDQSLSKPRVLGVWDELAKSSNGLDLRTGSISLVELHEYLGKRFGKDKTSKQSGSVIERVIAKIRARAGGDSGMGIKGLAKYVFLLNTFIAPPHGKQNSCNHGQQWRQATIQRRT